MDYKLILLVCACNLFFNKKLNKISAKLIVRQFFKIILINYFYIIEKS